MEQQLSENRTLADQIREVLGQQEQWSEASETGLGLLGDLLNMPASIAPEPDPMSRRKKKKPEQEQSRGISR